MASGESEAKTLAGPAVSGHERTLVGSGDAAATIEAREGAAAPPTAREPVVLGRGSALGRYVVLDKLGAGGMGVVYAAFDPELDRRVAIKLLHTAVTASSDAPPTSRHARLLREAQAMARLNHPNVITVYDVGSLGSSVFVAMEFVAGQTLADRYRAAWKKGTPDWRETLREYLAAGRGLAAAHAAGVVHRDFKPENVMIGDDGRVLVLDFGLARPTMSASLGGVSSSGESADALPRTSSLSGPIHSGPLATPLTRTGAVMGTPAYMSPEQMLGDVVDAPADQFSFCVGLYQALYGERPFSGETFASLTTEVLAGRVREPPKGTRVPTWVRRAVLRGLSVNPAARYPSMHALLAALQRDPARRRRWAWLGAAGVAMLGGAVALGTRMSREPDPCAEAGRGIDAVWNASEADRVREVLGGVGKAYADEAAERIVPLLDRFAADWKAQRTDACAAARVRGEQSEEVMSLRTACLDRALYRVEAFVDVLSDADASVAGTALGSAHALPDPLACGDVEALMAEVPPPDDPAVRAAVDEIRMGIDRAIELANVERFDAAEAPLRALLTRAESLDYPPIVAEVLLMTAKFEANVGRAEAARDTGNEAVLAAEAVGADRLLVSGLLHLAYVEGAMLHEFERGREFADRADAVITRRGRPAFDCMQLERTRAGLDRATDDWKGALAHYEKAWELAQQGAIGEDDPDAANLLAELGMAYTRNDKLEDAERIGEKALAIGQKIYGSSHPNLGLTLVMLGRLHAAREQRQEAAQMYSQARDLFAASLGEGHPNVCAADNELALTYSHLGRIDEAARVYERGIECMRTARGPRHLDVAAFLMNYGSLLHKAERFDDALRNHEAALEIKRERLGDDHRDIAFMHDLLGEDLRRLGRFDEAIEHYRFSLAFFERNEGDFGAHVAYARSGLGLIALERGKVDEAIDELSRARAIDEKNDSAPDDMARVWFGLARAYWEHGDHDRAVALAREAIAGWELTALDHAADLETARAWLKSHHAP